MLSWKHGQLSEEVPSEICAALDSDERDENAGACNVLDRQITGHWSEKQWIVAFRFRPTFQRHNLSIRQDCRRTSCHSSTMDSLKNKTSGLRVIP